MALNKLKKRLDLLESQQPQSRTESVMDKIQEYERIIDRGDFDSSEAGRELKRTIEQYEHVIEEIAEE